MNENTNPVNPDTNDADAQPAANPDANATGEQPASEPARESPDGEIVQTPANAIRDAHLQTARQSYAGGKPLSDCVAWLRLQGHEAFDSYEKAAQAIQAD